LPPALGGSGEAPSPAAYLLGALAGSAAEFIRDTLAPELGVRIDAVEATARCRIDTPAMLGTPAGAPDGTAIDLDVDIQSPDGDEAVERLFAAWRERCPVYRLLCNAQRIETRLRATTAGIV
jgi:uncharacterized OsmC-like protein